MNLRAPMRAPKSNEPCWCGSGAKFKRCHGDSARRIRAGKLSPLRAVPAHIERPPYAESGRAARVPEPRVKSADVIERMRRTGRAAAEVLAATAAHVRPGITTDELDAIAHAEAVARDAYPSPLNYNGFPKSICTSVNEVVCHGIPDDRPLAEGDIVNLDITLFREGVHGDLDATYLVGEVDSESRRLVRVTAEALERGIDAVRKGRPISDIGAAIQQHAEAAGYGVVRDFVGHGIGEQFHTDLQIPHYYTPNASTVMEPGMTFTIEPMITMGSYRFNVWADGWTAVTTDGLRTAQFEHTVLVTDDGVEILTALG